ncbi:MAG: hypothetical protein ACLPUO_13900, partial [Streptosporangiaceae bacterium]
MFTLIGMCGNWTGSTNECLMSARWSVASARVVYRPALVMGVAQARKGGHRVILWKTSHSASEGVSTM